PREARQRSTAGVALPASALSVLVRRVFLNPPLGEYPCVRNSIALLHANVLAVFFHGFEQSRNRVRQHIALLGRQCPNALRINFGKGPCLGYLRVPSFSHALGRSPFHWARAHGQPCGFHIQRISEPEHVLSATATIGLVVPDSALRKTACAGELFLCELA